MFNPAETKKSIVTWIKDFFGKPEHKDAKAVIGISGGLDSSLNAALCVEAIGSSNVIGVLLPDGEQHDIDDAFSVAAHLDISHYEINMKPVMDAFYKALEDAGLTPNELVYRNSPARMRSTFLYAVCAIENGRFCNNANLSEVFLGWRTKGADTVGDFAPIKNLVKGEVVAIAGETELLPCHVGKVPEDGLSGISDEENFGFSYEQVDTLIRSGSIDDAELMKKILHMNATGKHKEEPMPAPYLGALDKRQIFTTFVQDS
jgi:NAD+ synthase